MDTKSVRQVNQDLYETVVYDYKFDAPVEDIDIPRVLSENRKAGEDYVILMNDGFFMAFFAKKIAKRLLKHKLIKINEVQDEALYGFVDPDTSATNSVNGKHIKSVGFTYAMICRNTELEATTMAIGTLAACEMADELEKEAARIDKENDTRPRREIKVLTGK